MTGKKRYYFAYGSNMELRHMAFLCPGARARGKGALADHRFIINAQGYATMIRSEFRRAFGVLWTITEEHEAALDDYEGVASLLYRKTTVPVLHESGIGVEALIYLANNQEPGHPEPEYLDQILAGAAYFQLPFEYRRELRSWASEVPALAET